ncbi:MAG: hypothetical protein COB14_04360 [Alphaproteobacteria bacterium]|nr:MAG: hypothetical protein COB14_04360 [Alphaproteobacteria bacterium]
MDIIQKKISKIIDDRIEEQQRPRVDNFYLANADLYEVSQGTFTIIDAVQKFKPSIQALSMAVIFLKLCKCWNLNALELFAYANNIIKRGSQVGRAEFQATDYYLASEVRKY